MLCMTKPSAKVRPCVSHGEVRNRLYLTRDVILDYILYYVCIIIIRYVHGLVHQIECARFNSFPSKELSLSLSLFTAEK